MRVVVVLGTPDGTGAHRMAETLVLSLVRGGHEAVFLTDTGPLGPEVRDRAQGALDGLRGCGVEVEHGHVSRRTILRVARRLGGEVVLVGFEQRDRKHVALASLSGEFPSVLHVGNPHRFWGRAWVRRVKEFTYAGLVRRGIDGYVATSQMVKEDLLRLGVRDDRVCVIPNGISMHAKPKDGAGSDLRRELELSSSTRIIVSVGRIDPQKGHDVLLRALARLHGLPDWHCVVIGDESQRNRSPEFQAHLRGLRDLEQRPGVRDHLTWLGFRDDVRDLLASADVFVHPSRWEGPGLCLAVMEAMSAGLYCIIARTGDWPKGFEQGCHGVMVEKEDPVTLAEEIERALRAGPAALRETGAAARALIAERYDANLLMDRVVDFISTTAKRVRS